MLTFSVLCQTFYGLTFRKAYTHNEIKDHFWDNDVTVDGDKISVTIAENEIQLEFGCFSNHCDGKILTRILSFYPSESKANSMYEEAKIIFGKPTGGFEEENIYQDKLFNGPSIKEKHYIFYYNDKYLKGDVLSVELEVSNAGYKAGKLDKYIVFDVKYHTDVRYWRKPESYSSKGDNYLGGLYKGWKMKKYF